MEDTASDESDLTLEKAREIIEWLDGLNLTKAEIGIIDAKAGMLRAYTANSGGLARLKIVIKNGKLRFCEVETSESFLKPH